MECILYNTIISQLRCIGRGPAVIDYPPLWYQYIPPTDIEYISDHLARPSIVIWLEVIMRKRRLCPKLYAAFVYKIAQPRCLRTIQMCRVNNLWTSWTRWLLARDTAWQHAASWSILWPLTFCLHPEMHYISFSKLTRWRHAPSASSCCDSGLLSHDTVTWVNVML